jgi:hypothetical protein
VRRIRQSAWIFVVLSVLNPVLHGECIPFAEALKHVGEGRCVTGRVLRVRQGPKGTHYLDFCEDYRTCKFTAVIFHHDLRHVGDIRQLEGRQVEIRGDVKMYDGRAEIIVEDASQLGGDGARLPRLPKDYDVEQRGHYSSGTFSHPSSSSSTASTKRQPASIPAIIPQDSPE